MNYPVYQPTYHPGAHIASTIQYPTMTAVGASAPRMLGGSSTGFAPLNDNEDEDDFLDWGDGDGESTGGTIGDPDGDYIASGVPVGNACWPLLFCLCLYVVLRAHRMIKS